MAECTLLKSFDLSSYLADARVPTAFFLEIQTVFYQLSALLNATSLDSYLGMSLAASASSAANFFASSRAFLSLAFFGLGTGKLLKTYSTVLMQ